MKKAFLRTIYSVILCTIVFSLCKVTAFAKTYIAEIVPNEQDEIVCVEDHSWSMENTFHYESNKLYDKINNTKIEFAERNQFCDNSQTALCENINSYINNYNIIVLISDLWNTTGEELKEADNKTLIVMVPYYSTFSEGVNHVDDVVNNTFLNKLNDSTIYVQYLDGVINTYTNVDNINIASQKPNDSND